MSDGYTNRDMTGALFPNDKGGNPARPDWRGDFTVDGKTIRLAGWIKQGRKGEFISLKGSVDQPRDDPHSRPPSQPGPRHVSGAMPASARNASRGNDLDDEIPF